MVDYREILRLSSDSQNSQRSIVSRVHSSRNTVQDAQKAGIGRFMGLRPNFTPRTFAAAIPSACRC